MHKMDMFVLMPMSMARSSTLHALTLKLTPTAFSL